MNITSNDELYSNGDIDSVTIGNKIHDVLKLYIYQRIMVSVTKKVTEVTGR